VSGIRVYFCRWKQGDLGVWDTNLFLSAETRRFGCLGYEFISVVTVTKLVSVYDNTVLASISCHSQAASLATKLNSTCARPTETDGKDSVAARLAVDST
jgi:hypothetical protein